MVEYVVLCNYDNTYEVKMEKTKRKSKIKQYLNLAQPNFWYVFLEFLFQAGNVALKAMDTVFAARITVGLYHGITTGDFSSAYINLLIEFVLIVIRNLCTWFEYRVYIPIYTKIYTNVQGKIINKVIAAKESNFEQTSPEKIINIIGSNVETVATCTDQVSKKFSKLVQVIISISIVAATNIWVALALLGLSLLNFFILKYINKLLAAAKKKQYEAKDDIYAEATKIMEGKSIITELGIGSEYNKEFIENNIKFTKATKKKELITGFKSSFFYIFYWGMTAALTAFMIYLVSGGSVPIEMYLVVVPYFLTITELLNDFYEVTGTIADVNVAMNRIDTVLNFTSDEMNKFGNISQKFGGKNISFVGVNYTNGNINSPYVGKLVDVDISFASNYINVICGPKRSGKRLIFNMLRRKITPDSGVITLDNYNLKDYDTKTFKSNIYYCSSNPIFINGTIMENLMVSTKNKNTIMDVCKELDIYDTIMALPKGFDTIIDEKLTRALLFLIGMARALLTGCETLMVYEIPNSLMQKDKQKILRAMIKATTTRTVLFFTHDTNHAKLGKTVYYIADGAITNVKVNDHPITTIE